MGHGMRQDDAATRLWYVTTGYLAQLISHAPAAASRYSHIILDECHERSVHADVSPLRVPNPVEPYEAVCNRRGATHGPNPP